MSVKTAKLEIVSTVLSKIVDKRSSSCMDNMKKNSCWQLFFILGLCFVIYFGVSSVVTLMVPYHELSVNTAVADAFMHVGAHWAKYVVSAGAGLSMLCCTLVSMFPLPRMMYSMAQDGLIFKTLSRVNEKSETPIIATVVSGIFTGKFASYSL